MSESSVQSPTTGWRNYVLGVFALLVLVVGSYWPSMHGDFLWDDDFYVTNNKSLRTNDGIEKIWLEVTHPQRYLTDVVPQFYPMTITTFWVQTRGHDWQDPLPSWPFHLVNVLLHFCSAWMLWTILRRLGVPGAFVAAAIWALHPVQVESVAWITERKNVLSVFFLFASVIVYLRFAGLDLLNREAAKEGASTKLEDAEKEKGNVVGGIFVLPSERGKLYALALILFICSVLSKSVTGTMPAVMLVLIWWKRDPRKASTKTVSESAAKESPAKESASDEPAQTLDYESPTTEIAKAPGSLGWEDVLPLIPFFLLAIAMGAVTRYYETYVVGAQGPDWDINPIQRLFIAGGGIWFYAYKLICPAKLIFIYPRWDLHSPLLAIALGATVAFVGWLYVARERIGRGPITVALLFIGMLVPALGFVNYLPMRYSFVADHFQYLSSAALIAGGVWALHRFFTSPARFTVASALILGAVAAMTWSQNHVYTNVRTLWADTISKNPEAWIAENNLGLLDLKAGHYPQAQAHFNRALEIRPTLGTATMNLGLLLEARGDLDGAIDKFKEVIAGTDLDPMAQAYIDLGEAYQKKGDFNSAFAAYWQSAQINPRNLDAINGVGVMLMKQGDLDHAKAWFDDALQIDPFFLPAHVNLGNLLFEQGDFAAAQEEYATVLKNDRNNVTALNGVGLIAAQLGAWDLAIQYFNQAVKLDPEFTDAQKNLIAAIRHKQQAATQPAATMPLPVRGSQKPGTNSQ